MGEPWLDSLSEDWNSEPRLSSPASSFVSSKHGTQDSRISQSRIPHLAHNMRKGSLGGSFLKPRSSRGIAKSQGIPVLSERSASSLNLPGSSAPDGSLKRVSSSTFPRKTSSNFSDSQQSVQHHTINTTSNETPEWKKRIQNGEDVASDGFDLFSPSKLEGMFAQPVQSTPDQEHPQALIASDPKPWSSLKFSNTPTAEQHQGFRTSRSRAPPLESLPELTEEEDDGQDHSMSAISSELARQGSMRGLVKRRISDLEQARTVPSSEHEEGRIASPISRDPRWRTLSGQQEIRNEVISPLTESAKNTISTRAMRESIELDSAELKARLVSAKSDFRSRPSSRSSDRDISYDGLGSEEESLLHEVSLEDVTSHSLPEDLSMGTQDFMPNKRFTNARSGSGSAETSLWKRKTSSVNNSSQIGEPHSNSNKFRSSPPPYNLRQASLVIESNQTISPPASSLDNSVVHHDTSPQRPASVGSPLKLFGNRDTYTNNKLLRVLSQYEEDDSDQSRYLEESADVSLRQSVEGSGVRMSKFGQGELDAYNFDKEVVRTPPAVAPAHSDHQKIFQSFTDLTIDDEGTIPGSKSVGEQVLSNPEDSSIKRQPSSPAKDRTPKRRRTLLRDEIMVGDIDVEINIHRVEEKSSFAGRKRKNARPGEGGTQANPEVLASRSILQPQASSRKTSIQSQRRSASQDSTIKSTEVRSELTEALAAELASFAQGVSQAQHDFRKPSLATKDYMAEANKVMEFIRARGKPTSRLQEIQEPDDTSALDADKILDIEVDDDSTVEPFSRPPSREGPIKSRNNGRVAKHDFQTASHLQKFKDSDDLEIVAGTSEPGDVNTTDDREVTGPTHATGFAGVQESDPPNTRILNENEVERKRKHSTSTSNNVVNTAPSSGSSTRRTFVTETSVTSGHKGMITSGKVSIPDNIGTMTFDREKQIWIKQNLAKDGKAQTQIQLKPPVDIKCGEATLDDDPFEDIPDLSIDEQREATLRVVPKPTSWPSSADIVQCLPPRDSISQPENTHSLPINRSKSQNSDYVSHDRDGILDEEEADSTRPASQRLEASKHEERLHQGIPSIPPSIVSTQQMQPRVVTIAFSSPMASEIPRLAHDSSAPASDDEDYLPPDDSDEDVEYLKTPKAVQSRNQDASKRNKRPVSTKTKKPQHRSLTIERRPVSRIEERDEDAEMEEGMSLVPLKGQRMTTPIPANRSSAIKTVLPYKGTSILCLTPLSEFTMHQADKANHPEESFVQERAHPKALLQAHGALALSVDTLIKAITDSVPDEPFWEQLRKLDLSDSRLESVYGLEDYCSSLEVLDMSHNQLSQLDGLPSSLRNLNMSHNHVNDFTSWGHLPNLQRVDVSENQLENLEGFSSLIHLRRLNACNNNIHDIEGILDLDSIISLNLQGNELTELDFEGVDMPELEELNLSSNKLISVLNMHCLPRLKKLNLSGNSIADLRVTEPLTHLKALVITKNELESLDLAMFPALRELDVDENCIKTLGGLPEASQLRRLSVRNQRTSSDIVNFVLTTENECEEIFLSSNVLPEGQMKLPLFPHYNLQHLEMAACGLRAMPVGFGERIPNCRVLNLNFNAVSELSPLLGNVKMQELLLASNRIRRLRRTCLTISRMPAMEKIDLRSNPLTVGFYAPEQDGHDRGKVYLVPRRSMVQDTRWLQTMDETTGLRRRMIELLLLEGCPALKELDGLPVDKERFKEEDSYWDSLKSHGVLMKTIEARPPSAIEMAVPENIQKEQATAHGEDKKIGFQALALERSVLVE